MRERTARQQVTTVFAGPRVRVAMGPWRLLVWTCLLGAPLSGCQLSGRQGGGTASDERAAEVGGPISSHDAAEAPFVDVAAAVGLTWRHVNGREGGGYFFPEIMGSGTALFDYDNDGDLDLYLVQAGGLEDDPAARPSDRLFRNDLADSPAGEPMLGFTDVTAASGIVGEEFGMGVATGDYDNDGWIDLYVTDLGRNRLWRNRGDGSFEDVTEDTGTADPRWGSSAVFFDFDRDGWLDLFVTNYVDFSPATHIVCTTPLATAEYCGPTSFRPEPDRLFRNRGRIDGQVTFEDVSLTARIQTVVGSGLGVVATDVDADGWLDLVVANDQMANFLWLNRGDGTFREGALAAGVAVNEDGVPEAGMGIDVADVDGDGDEDLILTHLRGETHTLYRNEGGWFSDRSSASGLGAPSLPLTGFGGGWLDVDLDGRLDLLIVHGAVKAEPSLLETGHPYPYAQPDRWFHQNEDGRFSAGPLTADARPGISRGAAFGDVDNDGDLDVVVVAVDGPVSLLLNRHPRPGHWLGLELRDEGGRHHLLGARAGVERAGRPTLWRRSKTDGSYCSARDPRLLFGLGDRPAFERVIVVWPDGSEDSWSDLSADRYHVLRRGSGQD